ncbi:cytochrome P450 [Micromonospora zhanjiangensis]|uniref:Cytochrome P450 n=1 Tax=Micromonospora zhanjiangensis TaxID=1522057 RepID=A0ABV8KIH1_9ACTN
MTDTATELPAYPFDNPRDPFIPLAEAQRSGLVGPPSRVRLPTGGWAWLVTRHADIRHLLRQPGLSSDLTRPGFPLMRELPADFDRNNARGSFIRMDGAEHAKFRRILTPEFMIKNIRRLEPLIQQTVDETLNAMRDAGPPADLVQAFALPVPSMVICHLLGVPYQDHEFFQTRSNKLINLLTPVEEVRVAADELSEYLDGLVTTKLAERPAEDLLSRLVHERLATGELTREEIVGVALLLLIAGHETTANMIGLSTLVLLREPERFAALGADPTGAAALVEELLRYLSIVRTGLLRVATEDTEIGGQPVRAGEGVIALLSLANRDEAVFAEPDGFSLDRSVNPHIAFGFGVHQCIGQPLARAELRIALVELARRFPTLRTDATPEELPKRDTSVVYGLAELPVTW